MGSINLTKLGFDLVSTVGNAAMVQWRKSSDPDVSASYTGLPDATIDLDGTILSPLPYTFATPDTKITVKATLLCNGQTFTKEFIMCGPLTNMSAQLAAGCAAGWTLSPDGTDCSQVQTQAPIIDHSNWCYAPLKPDATYSAVGSNIYLPGFPVAMSNANFSSWIDVSMTAVPLWQSSSAANGPMNENGVWLDNNCDGTPDNGNNGDILTISGHIFNAGPERTVYVGLGADNWVKFVLNDIIVVDNFALTAGNCSINFTRFNLYPVTLKNGDNFFNLQGRSDGSGQDGLCMIVYDNTKAQLQAATSYAQLNILFNSKDLRGQGMDVAHCADGWSLDTSGGAGNYVCKQTAHQAPNSTAVTFTFTPDPGYRNTIRVNLYKASDLATIIGTKDIVVTSDAPITDFINVAGNDNYILKFIALECPGGKQVGQLAINKPVPTCTSVTNVRLSNISKTGAQVDWDYGTPAPASGYIIKLYKFDGTNYNLDRTDTKSIKQIVYSSLTAGSLYRVSVQADCNTSKAAEVTADFETAHDPYMIVRNLMTSDPGSPYIEQVYYAGIDNANETIVKGVSKSYPITPGVFAVQLTIRALIAGHAYTVKHMRGSTVINSITNVASTGSYGNQMSWYFNEAFQDKDELQAFY